MRVFQRPTHPRIMWINVGQGGFFAWLGSFDRITQIAIAGVLVWLLVVPFARIIAATYPTATSAHAQEIFSLGSVPSRLRQQASTTFLATFQ